VSVGEIYDEKANSTTQNLEVILEPILLVIVWLGVLGVAVAVILPIYGLIGGLGA
jgi:type II secretory pathway component PulF